MNFPNPEVIPFESVSYRVAAGRPGELIRLPLRDGPAVEDAMQIVAYLKQLSLHFARVPLIREFTVSLFPSYFSDNDLGGMLRIIAGFVRDRLTYVPDPVGTEYVVSPIVLLERISRDGRAAGDCDDHVLLFNAMAGSVGFEIRVAGVHLKDAVLWDHVISQVWFSGRWRDVDLCMKSASIPDYPEKLVS